MRYNKSREGCRLTSFATASPPPHPPTLSRKRTEQKDRLANLTEILAYFFVNHARRLFDSKAISWLHTEYTKYLLAASVN